MRIFYIYTVCLGIFIGNISGQTNNWLYQNINLPNITLYHSEKTITVAVIDDGFRFTHKDIQPYLYKNPKEIPDNKLDDDNNGFIDDNCGWDISDNDNNPQYPSGRENDFYHGTAVAGLITKIVRQVYGEQSFKYLKIIPVKVLSNNAANTAINNGYSGIKYAMTLNPDIICCAWSGGKVKDEEKKIVDDAIKKGIIIIASAGNFYSEIDQTPASLPEVWDIASVDSTNKKLKISNYSRRVDFSLPGANIKMPFTVADNSYIESEGTSVSAAVMTACAAIIKIKYPLLANEVIKEALLNTATPLDSINLRYSGKLGAGIPNVTKALKYIENPDKRSDYQNKFSPKGVLVFNPHLKNQEKTISPLGAFDGFFIKTPLSITRSKLKGKIKIYNNDSLLNESPISSIRPIAYYPGNSLKIIINAPSKTLKKLQLNYEPLTIDSTKLFCKDIQYLNDTTGEFSDGSGEQNYANNCDCKWLITVPEGKRIRIEFSQFDTQAKVDFLWLFDGKETLMENIIAKFSGPKIPPVVTSTTNQVLVWFVSDGFSTYKGWNLKYKIAD